MTCDILLLFFLSFFLYVNILVLLSALGERVSVSRIPEFFYYLYVHYKCTRILNCMTGLTGTAVLKWGVANGWILASGRVSTNWDPLSSS